MTLSLYTELGAILGEATRQLQAVHRAKAAKGKAANHRRPGKAEKGSDPGKPRKGLVGKIAARLERKKAAKDSKPKKASDKKAQGSEQKSGGSGGKLHSPFKRKKVLGTTRTPATRPTGVKVPVGTREVSKKKYWSCSKIASYQQMCKGRNGERMKVKINRAYKKGYNKSRKRWEKVLRHHTKKYPKGKYAQRAAR